MDGDACEATVGASLPTRLGLGRDNLPWATVSLIPPTTMRVGTRILPHVTEEESEARKVEATYSEHVNARVRHHTGV